MKDLTIASIRELLQLQRIIEKYQELAPFTWAVLKKFTASPNKWHRQAAGKETAPVEEKEGSDWDDEALAIASSHAKDAVVTLKDSVYEMGLPVVRCVLQFQGRDEMSRD
jgi:hypothetical protein